MCASRLQRPEDARELELQIRVNIHEVLESKLVLLQEQDVLLPAAPSLQPPDPFVTNSIILLFVDNCSFFANPIVYVSYVSYLWMDTETDSLTWIW